MDMIPTAVRGNGQALYSASGLPTLPRTLRTAGDMLYLTLTLILTAGDMLYLTLTLILTAGDMLYLPRGYIHQAISSDAPSLHLTFSTGRLHTWRDLLEVGVVGAIDVAAAGRPSWRRSLPVDLATYMGVVHSEGLHLSMLKSCHTRHTHPHPAGGTALPHPLCLSRRDAHRLAVIAFRRKPCSLTI